MIDKNSTVSNPLTIIAIFSGIAEISGTAVLPLLETENQSVYLWFLMIFPFVLISMFFITLNFNYKVLYAPSDFKDESNFLKLFGKSTPGDKIAKIQDEIKDEIKDETEKKEPKKQKSTTSSPQAESKYREIIKRNVTATYYLSEELVMNKLSNEFKDLKRELVLNSGGSHFMFDGVAKKGNDVYAIEIKYMKDSINTKSIKSSLNKINKVYKELPVMFAQSFNVILAIATDMPEASHGDIKDKVKAISSQFNYNIDTRIYSLNALENEFIGAQSA